MKRSRNPATAYAGEVKRVRSELAAGLPAWRMTPSGLVGADYAHLLLIGDRSYGAVVHGVAMYDPVRDEAVVCEPDGSHVLVTIGSLNAGEVLRSIGLGHLADSIELCVNSYSDEGPGVVSRELVESVREGALEALSQYGIQISSWSGLMKADPDTVWRQLGKRWVVQPWGLGTHDEILGGWV